MARVPTAYENGFGQVQRRADNTPFQNFDTPIDAFDRGGKAQARVGATLRQIADDLPGIQKAFKDFGGAASDAPVMSKAATEAQVMTDLSGKLGVENGVHQIRQNLFGGQQGGPLGGQAGQGPTPMPPKNPEKFVETEFSKISSRLEDDPSMSVAAKQQTLEYLYGARTNLSGELVQRQAAERKTALLSNLDGRLNINVEDAISNSDNPAAREKNMAAIDATLSRTGELNGWSAEEIALQKAKYIGVVHSGIITKLIGENRGVEAFAYFNEANSKGQINREDVDDLKTHTRAASINSQSHDLSTIIINGGGTLDEQIARVMAMMQMGSEGLNDDPNGNVEDTANSSLDDDPSDNLNSEIRAETITRLKVHDATQKRQRQEAIRKQVEGFWTGFSTSPDVNAIPVTLPPETRQTAMTYTFIKASGGQPETDPAVFDRLTTLTDDELAAVNLYEHRNTLSDRDFNALTQEQHAAINSVGKSQGVGTIRQQIQRSFGKLGLSGDANITQRSALHRAITGEVTLEAERLKRGLSYVERQEIVDQVMGGAEGGVVADEGGTRGVAGLDGPVASADVLIGAEDKGVGEGNDLGPSERANGDVIPESNEGGNTPDDETNTIDEVPEDTKRSVRVPLIENGIDDGVTPDDDLEFDTPDGEDESGGREGFEDGDELAMSQVPRAAFLLKSAASAARLYWRKRKRFKKGEDRYKRTNGGDFVQYEDGKIDLGEIDAQTALDIGMDAAPIRLERGHHDYETEKGGGEAHIEARHGDQIRSLVDEDGNQLFDSVADFVDFVANNWTELRNNKNGRLVLIVRDETVVGGGEQQPLIILEIKKLPSSNFYSVQTAGPYMNRYIKKMPLLKVRNE